MNTFNHLTQEERYHIYLMRKQNIFIGKIAESMGRHKSSISLELKRNAGKCGYHYDYRGTIPGRVDIDQRPRLVDDKIRLGDWDADTVIGKGHRGVLVTLTERVSKLNFAVSIIRKESKLTKNAIIEVLTPFKQWVYTITFDNGREFCGHQAIAKTLDCSTYFAKPYHSWQRGLNENHNGLLRQYFPKNEPLDTVTQEEVDSTITALNHRPRKTLNYKTPWEVFCKMPRMNLNISQGVVFIA